MQNSNPADILEICIYKQAVFHWKSFVYKIIALRMLFLSKEIKPERGNGFKMPDYSRFIQSKGCFHFLPKFFASLQKQIHPDNAFQSETEYFQYTEVPFAFSFGFLYACMCHHCVTLRRAKRCYPSQTGEFGA
jgi:hypothetical protein